MFFGWYFVSCGMGRYIVKLADRQHKTDYYMEWSTVVDAPVTWGMTLDNFKEYYIEEYGKSSVDELEKRLLRVEERGCSAMFDDLDSLIQTNRAKEGGGKATKTYILDNYCRKQADWLKVPTE